MSDCLKRERARFLGPSHEMPVFACLGCGYEMDHAATVNGESRPKAGDISICISCGHLSAFAEDLSLRPLTDAEMHAIVGNPVIIDLQRARALFKRWDSQ